jgi:hypothetical protein
MTRMKLALIPDKVISIVPTEEIIYIDMEARNTEFLNPKPAQKS